MRPPLPGALLAVALLVFCRVACAGDEAAAPSAPPSQRLCTDADLMGTFVLMDMKETPPGFETIRHEGYPYQYIAFYPENHFSILINDARIDSPELLDKHLKPGGHPPGQTTYTLSKDGVLDLYTNKKINYSYRCVANLAANGDYQRGDLIFTGYTKFAKNQLYNLYRRWY